MHISLIKSEVLIAGGEPIDEDQSNNKGFLRTKAEFSDSIQIIFDRDRRHFLGRENVFKIDVFKVFYRILHDFIQNL